MQMKRLVVQRYTFYITVKSIFLKIDGDKNGNYTQKFIIVNMNDTSISGKNRLDLLDAIYRRKIHDTNTLAKYVLCSYKLVRTARSLE